MSTNRNGAMHMAAALKARGIDTIFSLSGNQILPLYDALLTEGIRIIATRHEAAAVHMADAAGQLTGRASIALVTAAPGHTNALTALGVARANESPVVLLSGSADTTERGTHAFQEFPQAEVAAFFTKWAGYADDASQAASLVSHALDYAEAEVPGPVSLSLPQDTQRTLVEVDVEAPRIPSAHWTSDTLAPLLTAVAEAQRPIVLVSPWIWRQPEADALRERLDCPVLPIESPRAGSDALLLGTAEAIEAADLIVVLAPWDYAIRTPQVLHPRRLGIVQVWPEVDASTEALTAIRARPLAALRQLVGAVSPRDAGWAREVRRAQDAAAVDVGNQPPPAGVSGVHPYRLAEAVRRRLQSNDFVGMDGGEFVQWMRLGVSGLKLRTAINGKYGPVGPAFPFALGARATLGSAPAVVSFSGDGGFGYHAMEIETAARERLPVIAIVGTDGKWAAEWHLQEKHYGADRRIGTDLLSSQFEVMAEALGAVGVGIRADTEIDAGLDAAWAAMRSGKPVVVNAYVAAIPSPAALH